MKTLYLLPGTQCTSRVWQYVLPHLEANFQVRHLHIPNDCSLDDNAAQICDLLEGDKVNIIGFSLGGYIASYIACKFPHKVNKLMVIANSPCSLKQDELVVRKNTLSILQLFGYKGMPVIRAASLLERREEEHIDLMLAMDKELGSDTLMSQLEHTSIRQDLMAKLTRLSGDICFIYSQNDKLIDLDWMQRLAQQDLANISQKGIQGKSHMLILEEGEMVADEINTFFKYQ